MALHAHDPGFIPSLRRHYSAPESVAAEHLMRLKAEIKDADNETFWLRLLEGMTDIAHAQYGFVAKRMEVDDEHGMRVKLPALGEEGSCLRGVALYYNDSQIRRALYRDYKYRAWGSPCAYMKHNKVFLIPEGMSDFITTDPNSLPFAAEAYLAVPLFVRGKCFAHFGMMWTQNGLDARDVSWANTEMMMHTLEDMVTDRLVSGYTTLRQQPPAPHTPTPEPNPKAALRDVTATTPSLKPFAKSLSHELRTPMHGVVGMLDVMYATVQEQIEASPAPAIRQIFQSLREDIETIQVSCKRAVEAADNVVHAYDMNMQIPDTPLQDNESPAAVGSQSSQPAYFDYKPSRLIEGNNTYNPHKRHRTSTEHSWHCGNAAKIRRIHSCSSRRDLSPHSQSPASLRSSPRPPPPRFDRTSDSISSPIEVVSELCTDAKTFSSPTMTYGSIRELIPAIIQESLQVGDRPDSAVSEPTDIGEKIEVRSRLPSGDVSQKTIEWSVEAEVPETIFVEERDIFKLVSAVVLNAVKFTEAGMIRLEVKLTQSKKSLVIDCSDTGVGIPEDFQPQLFKAFSREDDSTTRSKEGLGLGLLVAKGLSRRLGGDLTLVRSEVSGPRRGSHFEIRVPLEQASGGTSQATTALNQTSAPSRSLTARPSASSSPSKTDAVGVTKGSQQQRDASSPYALKPLTANGHIFNSVVDRTTNGDHGGSPVPLRRSPPTEPNGSSANSDSYDRKLAEKYPLTFLIAEDNKINRKLLVSMLGKLGYKDVYEAFDGREAVRIMRELYHNKRRRNDYEDSNNNNKNHSSINGHGAATTAVDVVLMDLWMPEMDGYQATEEILRIFGKGTTSTASAATNGHANINNNSSNSSNNINSSSNNNNINSSSSCNINSSSCNNNNRRSSAMSNGSNGGSSSSSSSSSSNSATIINGIKPPRILAVSADVTDGALDRATRIGMEGFMTKPYKLKDLQRLIIEFCSC